jgi:hypothetical protein
MSQRDGKFPTISDGFYTSKVIQKNDRPNDRAAERLPSIPLSRGASAYGATTDKGVTKENTLVVGTSQSAPGGGVALPEEWTKMRVNPPQEDDSHMTKLEWENQIAKHILSLFATSHAVRNISEGNALLDFVEVDKSQVKSPDKRSNNTVDLLHTRPAQRPTPLPALHERIQYYPFPLSGVHARDSSGAPSGGEDGQTRRTDSAGVTDSGTTAARSIRYMRLDLSASRAEAQCGFEIGVWGVRGVPRWYS